MSETRSLIEWPTTKREFCLKRQCRNSGWFLAATLHGKIMAATRQGRGKRHLLEENDIFSTRLGRWSFSRGWPSRHGLMSATFAWAVAIFPRAKKIAKITENRDTAPLNSINECVNGALIRLSQVHLFSSETMVEGVNVRIRSDFSRLVDKFWCFFFLHSKAFRKANLTQ